MAEDMSPACVPGIVMQTFRNRQFIVATSRAQIREIQDVLKRPSLAKALPKGTTKEVLRFFLKLKKLTKVHRPPKLKWDFGDQNDHFLLDLAVHSKADFLITGDKALQKLTLVGRRAVVSPVEFIACLLKCSNYLPLSTAATSESRSV